MCTQQQNIYIHERFATNASYTQGIIPDPEEEEELIAMNRQLLDAVPESADFDFVEEDKTPGTKRLFLHVIVVDGRLEDLITLK